MATGAGRPALNLIRFKGLPILRQLQLEEKLLRGNHQNWCILNDGAPNPAIVMGISGKAEKLLHIPQVLHRGVPVIRRFSGGGTVVVDESTLFVTLICARNAIPSLELFPRPVMRWTEQLYQHVFSEHHNFRLREHDYVFGDRKFGGNAQSIVKDRWLHHTSFLWDFDPARMALLSLPAKTPEYREGRSHDEFVCRLKDYVPSRDVFFSNVIRALGNHFDLSSMSPLDVDSIALRNTLSTINVLDKSTLETLSGQS